MICETSCVTDLIVPSLAQLCGGVQPRDEKKSKLVFWRCDVAIPTGLPAAIAASLVTLLAANTVGATGKLRNFTMGDPQTTDLTFDDCDPSTQLVTQRDLTFEDFNAIDVEDDGVTASPYYDRLFWRTVAAQQKWNFGYTTCDGKLYVYTNAAGTAFMNGILTVFQSEDRSVANKIYEVKKGTVRFQGDPLGHFPVPLIDLSLYVGANPTLAQLY